MKEREKEDLKFMEKDLFALDVDVDFLLKILQSTEV